MKTLFKTKTPEETLQLGSQLATRIRPGESILLFGDLGTGKTQFAKGVAKGLGVIKTIKSPTFAYVNKYDLSGGYHLYHYDLYRLKHGEDFEAIGLEETMHDDHTVNIIEWADRMVGRHPKNYIHVEFHNLGGHHEIIFDFVDSQIAPETLVEKFWKDWTTPLHVRQHCKKVTEVCLQIGQALVNNNILINLGLLHTAGLLHDMSRICDFTELDRSKFHEEVTDDKWAKWVDLRERFQGMHHADVAAGALADEGYLKTAELVRLHNSLSILEEPEKLANLEAAILFYADKRVKHHEVVSLAERFRDGRERHGKYDDPKTRSMFEEVERRTYDLEKQLFSLIDLKPEDIV